MRVVLRGARIRQICRTEISQYDKDVGFTNKLYGYEIKIVTAEGKEFVCSEKISEEDLPHFERFMSRLKEEHTGINEITLDVYDLGCDLNSCRAYSYSVFENGVNQEVKFP